MNNPGEFEKEGERGTNKTRLWNAEGTNMYCPNNRRTITKEQLSCQQSCEDDLNCVGISFSNADNESTSKLCYICIDDNLTTGANNFAFYPKPFVEYDYATEYFIGK